MHAADVIADVHVAGGMANMYQAVRMEVWKTSKKGWEGRCQQLRMQMDQA